LEKKEEPGYSMIAGVWSRARIKGSRYHDEPAEAPQLRLGDLDSFGD
jgi:hypothetical protein